MIERSFDSNQAEPSTTAAEGLTYYDVQQQLQQLPDGHPGRLLDSHIRRLLAGQTTLDGSGGTHDETQTGEITGQAEPPINDLPPIYTPPDLRDEDEILMTEPPFDSLEVLDDQEAFNQTARSTESAGEPPLPTMFQLIEDARAANTKRMDDTAYDATGNTTIPDTSYTSRLVVQKGDYTPEQFMEFLHETRIAADRDAEQLSKAQGRYQQPNYFDTFLFLEKVPKKILQDTYRATDRAAELRHMFEQADNREDVRISIECLQRIYDLADPLDLYNLEGRPAQDPTVKAVLANIYSGGAVAETLMYPTESWPKGGDSFEETAAKRRWADRFLKLTTGLPEKQRDELLFATYEQTTDSENGYIDSVALINVLQKTHYNTHDLTPQQLVRLREEAGIVNFGNYGSKQLHLMSDLLNGDQTTIEHLQRGDTTVVLTDATGDYNGALKSTSAEFATENQRTLFFEINRPSDLYRHMLTLEKHGVKPSTIVIGAHGNPGSISFGPGEDRFILVNDDRAPNDPSRSVAKEYVVEARGLTRVVRDMMQDSRGIDDNPGAVGRRRIILKSCSQAKPVSVIRHLTAANRRDGEFTGRRLTRFQLLNGAILNKESMGATIATTARQPNLDVYAGEYELAVDRTADGIQFDRFVDGPFGPYAIRFNATRYMLDARGNVTEERVAEIKLRNNTSRPEKTGVEKDGKP